MARVYLYLGSAPAGEDCVQVRPDVDYWPAMLAEVRRYVQALRAVYGPEPDGALITIKRESHDFGSYVEAVVTFDDDNEEAAAYAYRVEAGLEYWPRAAA